MSIGWQVLPEFRVVQHSRDQALLNNLQRFFKAGKVVVNHGSRKELRIRKLNELKQITAFFEQNRLMTRKRRDFEIFRKVLYAMERQEHLTNEGLNKIANLCWMMNRKVKPRYLESSETLRRKSLEAVKIESDPCSDAGRFAKCKPASIFLRGHESNRREPNALSGKFRRA